MSIHKFEDYALLQVAVVTNGLGGGYSCNETKVIKLKLKTKTNPANTKTET